MMRKCHLNTCPVGVATQDPVLRRSSPASPSTSSTSSSSSPRRRARSWRSSACATFDELIGRADLLDTPEGHRALEGARPGLQPHLPPAAGAGRRARATTSRSRTTASKGARRQADREVPAGARARREGPASSRTSRNVNRTVGAMLSGELTRRGPRACPTTPSSSRWKARPARVSAPSWRRHHARPDRRRQRLRRQGPVGRRIVVRPTSISAATRQTSSSATPRCTAPPAARRSSAASPASASRCALSGATAVVEGTGDHGQYIPGGTVVVLDRTGATSPPA